MSTQKSNPQQALYFFRAVVRELGLVATKGRDEWTVRTHLPAIPHAAQLCSLGLLLLKGVDGHLGIDVEKRPEIEALLTAAHRKIKNRWTAAMAESKASRKMRLLSGTSEIQAVVKKAVKFTERHWMPGPYTLDAFTTDVQSTLARMVGEASKAIELKLWPNKKAPPPADLPGPVCGAIGLGVLVGGLAGRRTMTASELSAARVLSRMGSKTDESGEQEPKAAKRLRRTLKELAAQLPEERA